MIGWKPMLKALATGISDTTKGRRVPLVTLPNIPLNSVTLGANMMFDRLSPCTARTNRNASRSLRIAMPNAHTGGEVRRSEGRLREAERAVAEGDVEVTAEGVLGTQSDHRPARPDVAADQVDVRARSERGRSAAAARSRGSRRAGGPTCAAGSRRAGGPRTAGRAVGRVDRSRTGVSGVKVLSTPGPPMRVLQVEVEVDLDLLEEVVADGDVADFDRHLQVLEPAELLEEVRRFPGGLRWRLADDRGSACFHACWTEPWPLNSAQLSGSDTCW